MKCAKSRQLACHIYLYSDTTHPGFLSSPRWRAGMFSTAATSWGLRQTSSTTTRTASSMLSPAPGAGRPCFGATSSCTAGRAAVQLRGTSLFPPVILPPVRSMASKGHAWK
uniref:Uncharacterized protein n=1 Tax=Ixodes ricinus TaxID=34613 RepID=A0A0K8REA8_IXORI